MNGAVGWKTSPSCFSRSASRALPVRQSVPGRAQSVPGSTVPGLIRSAPVAGPALVKLPRLETVISVMPENSVTLPVTVTLSPTAGAMARPAGVDEDPVRGVRGQVVGRVVAGGLQVEAGEVTRPACG